MAKTCGGLSLVTEKKKGGGGGGYKKRGKSLAQNFLRQPLGPLKTE